MKVTVHLKSQSQPIAYDGVRNTYQKGSLFCVMLDGGKTVHKFPIADVFRVVEESA